MVKTINMDVIAKLTSNDWGWWRTLTQNLEVVEEFLGRYQQLSDADREVVRERLHQLRNYIDRAARNR